MKIVTVKLTDQDFSALKRMMDKRQTRSMAGTLRDCFLESYKQDEKGLYYYKGEWMVYDEYEKLCLFEASIDPTWSARPYTFEEKTRNDKIMDQIKKNAREDL